ncbi:MAG: recombinase family protein [Candidatus Angelobacter sp. Gp1-AA117]|nr:MAG: recombinase family protein [Candidatus Angelobacter sp. Gp1-AA117]
MVLIKFVKRYFAYIRVSTDKQGERGVSLQEQRDIIQRYASHKNLEVSRWFVEMETASKIGRPVFNEMLALLKAGRAAGVVIHKVDRGARNFRDWAEIGDLHDLGIEVHFATESLDLNTLGGMLSADLQAVMSVHYSRNLREETKKGYYGRLKQGLCPRPAPLGYLNNGEGKTKTIDPIQGPIVKQGFELYATGRYTLTQMTDVLYEIGLRTRETPKKSGGLKVSRNTIAGMLSNPFYIGALHVKKADRTFAGIHEPLVSKQLFDRVQAVKSGRYVRPLRNHQFLFSRLICCAVCGRSLVAETQKGHLYYRCHRSHNPPSALKGEQIEKRFAEIFDRLRLTSEEEKLIDLMLERMRERVRERAQQILKAEQLKLESTQQRLERLTDAYLDGLVEKEELEKKKTALTLERREIERVIAGIQSDGWSDMVKWNKIVERIKTAYLLYETGSYEEKRQMVKEVVSNRIAAGKNLEITIRSPFDEIVKRSACRFGCPLPGRGRGFWEKLFNDLVIPAQKGMASGDSSCA